jgi:hypothetical protein
MWKNFFEAGGWGMYPTLVFGFLLVATAVLYAMRSSTPHGGPRFKHLVKILAAMTFTSGLLGTCVGVCNSVHFLKTVPREDQLLVLSMGCEESLHNLVLALLILNLAGLILLVGAWRNKQAQVPRS